MLKTVKLAEILKRKIPDLHQINEVTRFSEEKTYIPLEEGLDTVTLTKEITMLQISLLKSVTEEQMKQPGYQPPLVENENTQEKLSFVSENSETK